MNDSATPGSKRVFIVGCRRSGTTWTMLLLAQHPEVVAVQQADFFRRLAHFGRWFRAEDEYGMCLFTSRLPGGAPIPDDAKAGLARLPLKETLAEDDYYDLIRPLARDTYDRFAACNPDTTVVVEQTPEYVMCWEEILRVFPDAYFLHIVRDPRSVFSSFRNAAKTWADPIRFTTDPVAGAEEWQREVTNGRRIAAATDRYIEINYEDLRQSSEEHLARLFAWLGLAADESQVAAAVEACALGRMQQSTGVAPRGFFRTGQVSGWREELSASDVRIIEHVAGDLMDELGYDLVHSAPVAPPLTLRWRRFRQRRAAAFGRWAWQNDGWLRRTAARTLKAFPGARKILLNRVKPPA